MPYRHSSKSINIEKSLERFAIGKKQDARPRHSSARPETNGKTTFFSRNGRLYMIWNAKPFKMKSVHDGQDVS